MKIAIMCSLAFSKEAGQIKEQLEKKGHKVSLPFSVVKVLSGEMTMEEIFKMKSDGSINDYTRKKDLIRWNWERMKKDEAILVVNLERKGIKNYIGGNTFLEIGFAHILKKKIFLWNDIPEIEYYSDEIKVINPVIVNQDVDLILLR